MSSLPKKLTLLFLFFLITPLTLGISLFSLVKIDQTRDFSLLAKDSVNQLTSQPSSRLYAAIPEILGEMSSAIQTGDARPIIIEKYLEKHDSPLLPYANELLAASEKYEVDYRLIVAIAQCESNLCKKSPEGSFNCWGFENGETKFLSWEQALDQVAKTLREKYLDDGLETPEEIMARYAPPSVEKGGPWAKCVRQFIDELEYGEVD
ncbi:MAG: hypothetical protein MUP45_04170 [Candidatus Marinimicrobia bacterium]|nr:hypothetical protein [Candidatus Neomarinimicrobiota bacterium]